MLSQIQEKFWDKKFVYQYFLILRYAVSLVASIIIVHSGLPKEDIGTYEWILFLVHTGTFFFHHGLTTFIMATYEAQDHEKRSGFIAGAYSLVLVLALLVAMVMYVLVYYLGHSALFSNIQPYIIYIIGYIIVMSALALVESVYFLLGKTQLLLRYIHFSQLGIIVLFFIVAVTAPSVPNFLMTLIGFGLVRWLYFVLTMRCVPLLSANVGLITTVLAGSIPILTNQILAFLMEITDGWMVKYFFDSSTFAVFRYGARELPLTNFLFAGLSLTYVSVLQANGFDLTIFKQKVNKLMYYTYPIAMILMLTSPYLFSMVYTDAFRDSAVIFNVYLLILMSRVLLPQTVLMAKQQFNIITYSTIIEIVVNVTLSLWWVHWWGIKGLVFATAIAYMVQKMVLIAYNRKVNGIVLNDIIDVKHYTLLSGALLLSFYFSYLFVL